MTKTTLTLTHWGAYHVGAEAGRLVSVEPIAEDKEPSALGQSLLDTRDHPVRITRPMVRASYLERGADAPREARGSEPFVAVSWPVALDLAAEALERVRAQYGNSAIYGGSYGWGSAGRFHHAQSQVHRFLKLFGGYTASRNTYSMGAMEVILPRILTPFEDLYARMPSWREIAKHSQLVVAFGGLALKNSQVNVGGVARHTALQGLKACAARNVKFVSFSPIADDMPVEAGAHWQPLRPNTDVAVMFGLAHVLINEGRVDTDFVGRCCVGFDRLRDYVLGVNDGSPKTPEWASRLSGVPADTIVKLGREIAAKRTMITVSWSVQRADHGEQPIWMAVALAAMSGSMGRPGGGIGIGYNSIHGLGREGGYVPAGALPQPVNPVDAFIPVARIADMLLNPGGELDYDGRRLRYPDIQLIYWCGGNPFHHHQDLGRLVRAWRKPETIIVHEPFWTPLARFADLVLPCATMLERNDLGIGKNDGALIAMQRALPPPGQARTDFEIFAEMAQRLGFREAFTEGRDEAAWLRSIYGRTQELCRGRGLDLPDFETFWADGMVLLPPDASLPPVCAELRADAVAHRLATPSGKVELFSDTIASFGYEDCPGHPVWLEPTEWLGGEAAAKHPLHLISNQPASRLHSQLDFGRVSAATKIAGREPCEINVRDAERRGIRAGDLVRIFNDRGSCFAAAVVSDRIMPGVVRVSTGAWYDPLEPGDPDSPCLHGNPNTLTLDKGTSKLAQATSAQTCLVEIERVQAGGVPPPRAHTPPKIVSRE